MRVAWLSLDEDDSDLPRFLMYFVAAVQTIAPNFGEGVLAALQASQSQPPTDALLTSLLNELAALPDRLIFVLDDYHTLDCKPIDEALTFLLDHLPPQTAAGHHYPRGSATPAGPASRTKSVDRIARRRSALYARRSRRISQSTRWACDLSADDIAALEDRTEGWIAGLQLAALSMQGRSDAASFIGSFTGSHHFVLDYLLAEVLHQQSAGIQSFLLRTSILDRLCGPLCEAVLLAPDVSGQATLEYLERANLFIIPLDNDRQWYRYHRLFADLLRQRLPHAVSNVAEYHVRASHWYDATVTWPRHFITPIAAKDFDRAADVAERAWQSMDDTFQTAAWLGWIKRLPEDVIRLRPVLCMQIGWAFSDAGEPVTSEIYLQYAERALSGAADRTDFKPLPGSIALARAYNAQVQGNQAVTVKYAELAAQTIPEDDFYRRAQAAIMLEFTQWATGNLEAALRAMHDWMDNMQKMGNLVFVVASAFGVADLQVALGRLRDAENTLQEAIRLAATQGREAESVTAHHHLELGAAGRRARR